MAFLSPDDIERIELITGYAQFSDLVRRRLQGEYTQLVVDRTLAILTELSTIDQQLIEARADNYVSESRGTKLNYRYHTNQLKLSATTLLRELCSILDIGLAFNKYIPAQRPTNYW